MKSLLRVVIGITVMTGVLRAASPSILESGGTKTKVLRVQTVEVVKPAETNQAGAKPDGGKAVNPDDVKQTVESSPFSISSGVMLLNPYSVTN